MHSGPHFRYIALGLHCISPIREHEIHLQGWPASQVEFIIVQEVCRTGRGSAAKNEADTDNEADQAHINH